MILTIITLFNHANGCRRFILQPIARFFLWLHGIDLQLPADFKHAGKCLYTFNHSSNWDIIIICALGLPNTRFFLSDETRIILPMTIVAQLLGTFYTPSQNRPDARAKCFQRAEAILRKSGDCVLLSPEGERVISGEIGVFNKGTFHLATNLGWPIVPLYFYISHQINPWCGFNVTKGMIRVDVLPIIPTDHWVLSDLLIHKDQVNQIYRNFHQQSHC